MYVPKNSFPFRRNFEWSIVPSAQRRIQDPAPRRGKPIIRPNYSVNCIKIKIVPRRGLGRRTSKVCLCRSATPACLPACLPVCLSVCLSVFSSVCLPACLAIHLFVCLSSPFICLFFYLSICLCTPNFVLFHRVVQKILNLWMAPPPISNPGSALPCDWLLCPTSSGISRLCESSCHLQKVNVWKS